MGEYHAKVMNETLIKDALMLGADIYFKYAMKYVCELMNMGCKQKDVDKLINLLMGILVTAQDAIADDTWQEYYIAVSLDSEEKQ